MFETFLVSLGVAVRPIWVARSKIVEDLSPCGILSGAAAMALVDDDQVEEIRGELALDLLPFSGPVTA